MDSRCDISFVMTFYKGMCIPLEYEKFKDKYNLIDSVFDSHVEGEVIATADLIHKLLVFSGEKYGVGKFSLCEVAEQFTIESHAKRTITASEVLTMWIACVKYLISRKVISYDEDNRILIRLVKKHNKGTISVVEKCQCHNPAFTICSRCQSVYYCSSFCQKRNWKEHKITCKSNLVKKKTKVKDNVIFV